MNGIILVNKEKNMTSHDVVNKVRKIFNTKRVGHLGTLDPLAEGLLAVCINDATKLVQFLTEHDKVYVARVCIGKSTDTYDLEGKVLEEVKVEAVSFDDIDKVISTFLGKQKQLPPIYSSIKVDGKKLYEYARAGLVVEIPERDIEIYDIKRISDVTYEDECCYFDLYVYSSKGTYIRSICNDLGKKLGLPSLMAGLTRIKSGCFTIENASTLKEIEEGKYTLYPMLDALSEFSQVDDPRVVHFAKNGRHLTLNLIKSILGDTPSQIVIKDSDKLLGIYQLENEEYKAVRIWN